jgi:formylglycine-generating enzyme required for sulfatase activity
MKSHPFFSPLCAFAMSKTAALLLVPIGIIILASCGRNRDGSVRTDPGTSLPARANSGSDLTIAPDGMALIPAGAFTMGDTLDGDKEAIPVSVTVSAFYMDTNLVSYRQWHSVYSYATAHGYDFAHAGSGKAPNHPVQSVDWYDAVKWSNARSQQAGLRPVYYTDAGLTPELLT